MVPIADWSIYVLRDPTDGAVRYVGSTMRETARLRQHLSERAPRHKSRKHLWLRGLRQAGLKPSMEIIEAGYGNGRTAAEKRWIKRFREAGADLVNGTPGWGWPDPQPEPDQYPKTLYDLIMVLKRVAEKAKR